MTLANEITIGRILLIPVFVLFCVYYGQGVEAGNPQEWHRIAAIGVFVLAAVSDGLDGYFARRLNQRSRFGAVLDPIADKILLLAAILTLSFGSWKHAFPLWFPVLVILRDTVILTGCGVLYLLKHGLDVKPSWTGKAATVTQMIAVTWIMLQLPHYLVSVYLAGILTALSGIDYLARGSLILRQQVQTN
jgi:cardiolipin synthase (CMP-forming)